MKKTISLVLVLALGLASVCLAAKETWTTKADMPTARLGLSTSVVDGKIYAIGGGYSIEGPHSRIVEKYDPVNDTWTRKADMPTGRIGHATSAVNGKIYVIGGDLRSEVSGHTVEEYDPATDTWTKKADMPTERTFLCTCAVDGKIYAIGGITAPAMHTLSTVEEYDPATDTWTMKADMPTPRWTASVSVVDGKIYAVGGLRNNVLRTVEEYDPATNTWARKADMPTARASLCTSVVNGKIYAIGGASGMTGPVLKTVEVYDPITDTWTIKADMPTARWFFSTSVLNGKIYAIGGSVRYPPHDSISTVQEYDIGLTAPPPDFNGDGIVDCADICIMVDHWHTDEPLYDIAPPPFGDGIVDVQDLIVLAEHLFTYPGAVAYWKLDEKEGDIAHDSVGDCNGTLNGGPAWQPTSGMIDGALELDGIDDYVSTPFVLNPTDGEFSVFAWIKGGAPGQVVLSQIGGADWLLADPSEGKLMTSLSQPVGRTAPPPLVPEFVITDGNWYRIGFVWDGSNRILYVDDVEVAKDTQPGLGSANGGLLIGVGTRLEPGSFWSGLIDDVRIYNRAVTP